MPLSVTVATVPPELLVAVPDKFPRASRVYLATAAKGTATVAGMTVPVSVYAHSPATLAGEQALSPRGSSAPVVAVCAGEICVEPIHSMAAAARIAALLRIRFDPVLKLLIDSSLLSAATRKPR